VRGRKFRSGINLRGR